MTEDLLENLHMPSWCFFWTIYHVCFVSDFLLVPVFYFYRHSDNHCCCFIFYLLVFQTKQLCCSWNYKMPHFQCARGFFFFFWETSSQVFIKANENSFGTNWFTVMFDPSAAERSQMYLLENVVDNYLKMTTSESQKTVLKGLNGEWIPLAHYISPQRRCKYSNI